MRLNIKCSFTVLALLSCLPALANDRVVVRRTEDVIYGRKHGMALTLDVFQPARPAPGSAQVGGNGCGLLFLEIGRASCRERV